MRTSYNRENNEGNEDSKDLSVINKSENMQECQNEEGVVHIDADYVEVDDATCELDDTGDIEELNEEILGNLGKEKEEDDVYYENLFSDGTFEPITPNFYKISKEVEDALLDECSDSTKDLLEDDVEEDLFAEDGDDVEEDLFADEDEDADEESNSISTEEKKSFLNKKIVVGSVIMLVALGVSAVGYNAISDKNNSKDLEKQIERMYTSSSKDDLKKGVDSDKLEKCYNKLEDVDKKERVAFEDELDTMSSFIEDKDTLERLNSPDYNLNSSDFDSSLEKVKRSVSVYKVSSLADTLKVLINRIEGDFKNYSIAKEKINSNIGNKNANIKELQGFVSKVNHNPNREDLQNILNNIGDEVKANKIVNDIKESSDKKLDEVTSNINNKVDEASTGLGDKLENAFNTLTEAISNIVQKIGDILSRIIS